MFNKDVFVEVTVKKEITGQMKALTALSVFFTLLFTVAGLLFNFIFLVLAVIYLFVTIFIFVNTRGIEYEYEYTNGVLEIYKIIHQRKRKKLVELESKDIVVMAPAGSSQVAEYKGRKMKTYDVTSMNELTPFYVLVYKPQNGMGEEKIFFEATEELAIAMRNACPRQVTVAPRNYEVSEEKGEESEI